jgi:hypothetical protein
VLLKSSIGDRSLATYDLPYAQEHLDELFQKARTGEDVIIARRDGRSCQLLPLADVQDEAPASNVFEVLDSGLEGSLVPA